MSVHRQELSEKVCHCSVLYVQVLLRVVLHACVPEPHFLSLCPESLEGFWAKGSCEPVLFVSLYMRHVLGVFFFCLSWAVNFHRQCNCAFQNTWLYLSEGDEGILGSIIWWTGGEEVAFCPCGHLSGCRNNRTKQLDCLWSTLQSLEEGLVSEMSGLILFVLSGAFILWILFILQPSCCHWSYLVGRITVYVWGKELKSGWKCFFFKGCLIRLEKVYFICIRWVVKEWRNNVYER